MTNKILSEDELRARLEAAGRNPTEIDEILLQYAEAASQERPDKEAISGILEKSQEQNRLRVRGFTLDEEQYEVLLGHLDENGKLNAADQPDATAVVRAVLADYLAIID